MFLPALLPLLLTATSLAPRPAFAVLLPPEGNDYPLYDFPSLQYLPHNSLAEYQDPRSFSEEEKMEISTRSTYFPLPSSSSSSDPSSSSSSSSSYPYAPSSSSPSSSASVATVSCTPEDLASMLNIDDLDKMIRIVSKVEGKSAKDVLLKLALKHGLHLKDRDVILPKNRARDYKTGPHVPPPPGTQRKLRFLGHAPLLGPAQSPLLGNAPPQRPLLHLRRPPVALSPTSPGVGSDGTPPRDSLLDALAIEVPAISPRGVSMPPRAVLVVLNAAREESGQGRRWTSDLAWPPGRPKGGQVGLRTQQWPLSTNPFSFKAKRLEAERCLGLQTMGRVTASPSSALTISVTRTRPLAEVIWESACLPRVADLLVHRDDIIVLAPR
nr:uncharacterized protein LOC113828101 isoform X1 [Penaeus vannamei]